MAREKAKFILCISGDSVSLCQLANQKGRAFLLSSQVVRIPQDRTEPENQSQDWLEEILKKFEAKQLKKVKDVLISSAFVDCVPLNVFYLREEHLIKSAVFELENLLDDSLQQYKFGLYRTEVKNVVHAFLSSKQWIQQLNVVLRKFGVKKPRIFPSLVMLIEEIKRQVVKTETLFLNVDQNAVTLIFRKNAETKITLIPVSLKSVAQKITQATGQTVDAQAVADLLRKLSQNATQNSRTISTQEFQETPSQEIQAETTQIDQTNLTNSQTQAEVPTQAQTQLNSEVLSALALFQKQLNEQILKQAKTLCGEGAQIQWVLGGKGLKYYDTEAFLREHGGDKIIAFSEFFKTQIAQNIDPAIVQIIAPMAPALFSVAALESKSLQNVVNFQSEVHASATAKKEPSFAYQRFVTAALCTASALFFYAQWLEGHIVREEIKGKSILAQKEKLSRIAKHIQDVQASIQEKERLLGDVRIYVDQKREWCQFFNDLKAILDRSGDVFLTSMDWKIQIPKEEPKTDKNTKKGEKKEKENSVKKTPKVQSTIDLAGTMYLGDIVIRPDTNDQFSGIFNQMFYEIKELSPCLDVIDIKVNVPQNGKITFKCTVILDPESKLLAL